ncbi:MAG TPA: hypothetical protein VJ927_09310 [Actinomycetota bacterium]|nr:hypothetical protein [Actinomycetota bacterium]
MPLSHLSRLTRLKALAFVILLLAVPLATSRPLDAKAVGTLKLIHHIDYPSGTDISFAGDRVFFTQSGAVTDGVLRIMDVSGAKPKVVGEMTCGGNQNDVAAISEDLIAVGSHWGSCGPQPSSGVNLIDVSDPSSPQQLGFAVLPVGTHTLTVHPSEPLIYASNSINDPNFIIDISNPLVPITIPTDMQTCHDITFQITKKEQLAFCAGGGPNTQIWDVSDPRAPSVISTIVDDGIGYHHEAMATPDGDYLVIGDEDSGGTCSNQQKKRELGAISIYDIRDRAKPKMVGFMNSPRGPSVCWAHNFNFIDNRTLVIGWWQAGTSIIDISDPTAPKETDFFQSDSQAVWSSYFYKGRIYVNSGSGAWVLDGE